MSSAFEARSLSTLDRDLAGLNAELGALERSFGAAAGGGAGLAAGSGALVGGSALLASGTTAGAGASTVAALSVGTSSAAGLAVVGSAVFAPAAAVGVGAAALASYRATAGNVKRLKSKIKELESKIRVTKRTLSKSQPRTAQRRIRFYEIQINMARKRLRRIERVMKRRIDRRTGKGKTLTARQQRLVGALNLAKRSKRQIQPVAQGQLQEAAFVRMGGPAIPRGLSIDAVKSYVDRVLPHAQQALKLGVGVDQATRMGMSQVQVPGAYQQIVARRVHFWLSRQAVPGRFQAAGQPATFAPSFAPSVAASGGSYYDPTQSGAFQPFPNGMVPQTGGGDLMAQGDEAPVDGDEAELMADDAEGADLGEPVPFYQNPKVLLGLGALGVAAWYFSKKGKKGAA
jgi:hypothetical protein